MEIINKVINKLNKYEIIKSIGMLEMYQKNYVNTKKILGDNYSIDIFHIAPFFFQDLERSIEDKIPFIRGLKEQEDFVYFNFNYYKRHIEIEIKTHQHEYFLSFRKLVDILNKGFEK